MAITWGNADSHVANTLLRYTDADGTEKRVTVPVDSVNTTLSNFDFSNSLLEYATEYKPDTTVIDLFNTPYEPIPLSPYLSANLYI